MASTRSHVYHDFASGVRDDRPGLDSCCARSGRATCSSSEARPPRPQSRPPGQHRAVPVDPRVGLRVLTGQGAQIDTTTAAGRLVFGIFAALAEFERELIRERTLAGLTAARTQRRQDVRVVESPGAAGPGPRWRTATPPCPRSAANSGIAPVTLYRYVGPQGQLREQGEKVLAS